MSIARHQPEARERTERLRLILFAIKLFRSRERKAKMFIGLFRSALMRAQIAERLSPLALPQPVLNATRNFERLLNVTLRLRPFTRVDTDDSKVVVDNARQMIAWRARQMIERASE